MCPIAIVFILLSKSKLLRKSFCLKLRRRIDFQLRHCPFDWNPRFESAACDILIRCAPIFSLHCLLSSLSSCLDSTRDYVLCMDSAVNGIDYSIFLSIDITYFYLILIVLNFI